MLKLADGMLPRRAARRCWAGAGSAQQETSALPARRRRSSSSTASGSTAARRFYGTISQAVRTLSHIIAVAASNMDCEHVPAGLRILQGGLHYDQLSEVMRWAFACAVQKAWPMAWPMVWLMTLHVVTNFAPATTAACTDVMCRRGEALGQSYHSVGKGGVLRGPRALPRPVRG